MGADLKAIVTPQADASRVAAIRNSLDMKDKEALHAFGERARLEVAASVERILSEVRSAEAAESADLLKKAAGLVEAGDPGRLTVKGFARLFVDRWKRLAKIRAVFQHDAALLESVAGDLSERAERLSRRAMTLDRLHAQAKTFILELDAYLDAGRQARQAPILSSESARELLDQRLAALEQARVCAIEQLSLVRTIQNVDAPLADAVADAARAARKYVADWTELLGLTTERKRKRIRPDQTALYETKASALERLIAPTAAVADARQRRHDAESQMEKSAKTLATPRKR